MSSKKKAGSANLHAMLSNLRMSQGKRSPTIRPVYSEDSNDAYGYDTDEETTVSELQAEVEELTKSIDFLSSDVGVTTKSAAEREKIRRKNLEEADKAIDDVIAKVKTVAKGFDPTSEESKESMKKTMEQINEKIGESSKQLADIKSRLSKNFEETRQKIQESVGDNIGDLGIAPSVDIKETKSWVVNSYNADVDAFSGWIMSLRMVDEEEEERQDTEIRDEPEVEVEVEAEGMPKSDVKTETRDGPEFEEEEKKALIKRKAEMTQNEVVQNEVVELEAEALAAKKAAADRLAEENARLKEAKRKAAEKRDAEALAAKKAAEARLAEENARLLAAKKAQAKKREAEVIAAKKAEADRLAAETKKLLQEAEHIKAEEERFKAEYRKAEAKLAVDNAVEERSFSSASASNSAGSGINSLEKRLAALKATLKAQQREAGRSGVKYSGTYVDISNSSTISSVSGYTPPQKKKNTNKKKFSKQQNSNKNALFTTKTPARISSQSSEDSPPSMYQGTVRSGLKKYRGGLMKRNSKAGSKKTTQDTKEAALRMNQAERLKAMTAQKSLAAKAKREKLNAQRLAVEAQRRRVKAVPAE